MIASLTGQGFDVQRACLMLGVSVSGYYDWKGRAPSARTLRHAWLAGEIAQVHKDSGGTYGTLWMTDITEHPTREGKIYCCAVIDAFSRMVVGWSIDSRQTGLLVANALGMALNRRAPGEGGIIHSDQGVQFASWVFSQKVTEAGLAPSVGAVGAPFDNAMVEAFWARMQVELLNRRRWKTRVELASAIHDYIEIWHNTKRRHSALNMLTPSEYENQHQQRQLAA